ncbi:ATP-binding protein [Agathobacter sp.]
MKNNKHDDERYIWEKLAQEYVSLYKIDLNSGKYEVLRLSDRTNAIKIVGNAGNIFENFDVFAGKYAEAFITPDDRAEFVKWFSCKNMKRLLSRNEKITYHYQSVSDNGEESYYEAYAVKGYVDDEAFDIFLGFRNIDSIVYKEKAIQEQLQNALDEARLSNEIISAIAKTYQYISRIDIQADYFEEISNRDEMRLGLKKEGRVSVSTRQVCNNIADEYRDAYLKFADLSTLPERMKNEATIMLEYRMKNGDWHKLRFIEKKRDETGKLTHVICVVRSISDTKKTEQRLMYQVAEAKRDAALKTRFLSNMSHDIRTPMNGIMGMIDVANKYPDDMDIQQKCRDQIMKSSKYLVSLVNDILEMNKLEAGDLVDQEISFDLTELLSRANREKQTQAEEKNIEYIVDWNRAELKHTYLEGNPVYLERLLTIISNNAIKFTPDGGKIHVWCKEQYAGEQIAVYQFGCSDNGIGMSEEFVEHAFDMFSQENETSRSTYEGSGLGLAIAKKIIDKLGGTINIESQKGIGTTVKMTVPFKFGNQDEIFTKRSDDNVSLEGKRVLLAEDNDINMEIARFMLENNGIAVEEAKDGLEAVKMFAGSQPGYYDAVFMDIMMPNLNGWDAARKIRSMKRTDAGNIPIIAMSANTFAEDIINSRISGMNEHLTKPLDEAKLIETLKASLADMQTES